MPIVRFTDPREFIDELSSDKAFVARGLVRITKQYLPSGLSPTIRLVTVVAAAHVVDDIVRFEKYCGDLWDMPDSDKKVNETAERLCEQLEGEIKKLGLTVRPGLITDPEGPRFRLRFAFTAVVKFDGFIIGRADENVPGFTPFKAEGSFATREAAQDRADELNRHLGLSKEEALRIVGTAMAR